MRFFDVQSFFVSVGETECVKFLLTSAVSPRIPPLFERVVTPVGQLTFVCGGPELWIVKRCSRRAGRGTLIRSTRYRSKADVFASLFIGNVNFS